MVVCGGKMGGDAPSFQAGNFWVCQGDGAIFSFLELTLPALSPA